LVDSLNRLIGLFYDLGFLIRQMALLDLRSLLRFFLNTSQIGTNGANELFEKLF
jgi:hypothetical protein